MKKRNILAENMRRFGTKNLEEQNSELDPRISGGGDVAPTKFDEFLNDRNVSIEDMYRELEKMAQHKEPTHSPEQFNKDRAIVIWKTLEWASKKWNTPEAIIQAAMQLMQNAQIYHRVNSYLPAEYGNQQRLFGFGDNANPDIFTWLHDRGIMTYDEQRRQWHRGKTVDEISMMFDSEREARQRN